MEKDRSHIYSQATIKRLYSRSGNRCAFPGCNIQFYSSDNDNNISNICHIEDASNYDRNLPIEAIETSLLVIIVDAFMRCNILEDPNKK